MRPAYDFTTLALVKDLDVAAPVAWAEIGEFRHIARWMDATFTYRCGDGGVGTVRAVSVAGATYEEVQVARTPLAYTYTPLTPFLPLYHATLSVEPTGQKSARIAYTFFWDQRISPRKSAESVMPRYCRRSFRRWSG